MGTCPLVLMVSAVPGVESCEGEHTRDAGASL